jgi:hypothetical protein
MMMRRILLKRKRRILLKMRRRILLMMRRRIVMTDARGAPPDKGAGRRHRAGPRNG